MRPTPCHLLLLWRTHSAPAQSQLAARGDAVRRRAPCEAQRARHWGSQERRGVVPRPQCPLLLLMRRHCHARAIQFRSPRTLSRRACLLRTWHVMEVPGWFASHCQELNAVPASASGRGCRYTCAALSPNVHMNDERRRAWHRACTSIPAPSNRIEISWRPWPLGPGLGLRRPHPHASRTSESRDIREFIGRARRARGSPALTGLAPPTTDAVAL